MSADETIRRVLRAMAWERAKGELRSMRQTFYCEKEKFDQLDIAIDAFVVQVEENGLHD